MRKILLFSLGIVVAIAFSSCAGTYKLEHSAVLNKQELTGSKTFTIAPFDEIKGSPQKSNSGLTPSGYSDLANGIRHAMAARGYTEDAASNLKITFNLFVERNADITTNLYPDYFYGRFGFYHPYIFRPYTGYTSTRIYKEGIWVVNLISLPQKMLLYSAAISTEISPKTLNLRSPDEVNKASEVLFRKFPVKPAKK